MINLDLPLATAGHPVGLVLAAIRDCRDKGQLSGEDAEALLVIVDELVSNVVKYSAGATRVQVVVELVVQEWVLTIADDGAPFDPLTLDDPDLDIAVADREIGGMGLLLVKSLSDSQLYRRLNNENKLVLRRGRSI